ncbi:unnamed protein product [Spirodela intermedia]|uniref:Uncharacterized protein n=1 Tax=Spirodela intermedia TaxID=51605 RepID=A0A7I8IV13_SPIIN|nr:unnamed protein product [Spirodela intermedia]CAA6661609.1 unnamed protein product [Spirodela intermedia]
MAVSLSLSLSLPINRPSRVRNQERKYAEEEETDEGTKTLIDYGEANPGRLFTIYRST